MAPVVLPVGLLIYVSVRRSARLSVRLIVHHSVAALSSNTALDIELTDSGQG